MSSSGVGSSSAACGTNSGRPNATVETIARVFQSNIDKDAKEGGKVGHVNEGELKGDLSEAKFGKDGTKMDSDACNLEKEKHTNDKRTYSATADGNTDHDGPCTGKGTGKDKTNQRFAVGLQWKTRTDVNEEHKKVLFPPRRLDMCTSNLENLKTEYEGFKGDKAKHSLLGDVMLAAKYEAEKIIELYKQYNLNGKSTVSDTKDKKTICRSVRNSFADIGDIIRGRDIWTKENGNADLQKHLRDIFDKIKKNATQGITYSNEEDPYTKLREHWWELNRKDIWKAMDCALKQNNITNTDCDYNNVHKCPLDDYIPQRLRWLTEWSEWYCKAQKDEYDKVKQVCDTCKTGTNNTTCNTSKCKQCQDKCKAYSDFITKWKEDWQKQKKQYEELYGKAKSSSSSTPSNDENQKYLNEFLKKLQKENKSNTTYSTAEGYIQQELKNTECQQQKEFCDTTSDKYVFRHHPSGYVQACACDSSTPCDVVKSLMQTKDTNTGAIGGCNPKIKDAQDTSYPKWTCEDKHFETGHTNACMPPRRQKLCVHYLSDNSETQNINKPDDLKNAFIKTGAAETFVHWQYYIKYGGNSEAENQLKSGKIPSDFLRSMMYTFGDLRDLCLDKDISVNDAGKNPHVTKARNKISEVFSKSGQGSQKTTPEKWWTTNGPLIWEGMLCGLSHHIKGNDEDKKRKELTNKDEYKYGNVKFGDTTTSSVSTDGLAAFASRPQFLRWMTEWGEHYCKTQYKHYMEVKTQCDKCNATPGTNGANPTCNKNGNECSVCQEKCKEYEEEIKKWKKNWDKMEKKYETLYSQAKQNGPSGGKDEAEKKILEYLKDLQTPPPNSGKYDNAGKYLKEEGLISECQEQTDFATTSGNNTYAFKTYPHTYTSHCTCVQKPPEKPKCTQNKILDAANMRQHDIASQLHKSGDSDKLRGDLSKAEFKNKNSAPKLETHGYCDFNIQKHGNDVRDYSPTPGTGVHHGPCTGKGKGTDTDNQRFIIGQEWKPDNGKVRDGHEGVLLPPRRRHMCTSNLENLGKQGVQPLQNVTDPTKYNHSFLGDVLLAAKFEGDDIVEKHLSKGDKSGICNAMKYSFADLGDIIRGRDIWSGNDDMKRLQEYLEKIFEKIEKQVGGTKYSGGKDENPKYSKLREAWWNANRDQVWKALTCSAPDTADLYIPTSGSTKTWERYKCGRDSYVPPDDYIPQRLRWMTEWSESYCKQLERNFWWLKFNCGVCNKAKKDSEAKNVACSMCSSMCKVYKTHVTDWKKQWSDQEKEYNNLYSGSSSSGGKDEIQKQNDEFFNKVKNHQNGVTCDGNTTDPTTYNTLSDYVTSMGGGTYCNDTTQTQFGTTKTSGGTNDEYVFKEYPHKYEGDCEKQHTKPSPKPKDSSLTPPCTIVDTILNNINANGNVGDCKNKYDKQKQDGGYPKWDCDKDTFKSGESGACMPPRRQKLCIAYLKENISDDTTLRTAFIKTAAAETFLAWQYYITHGKGHKNKDMFKSLLDSGTIPSDFKRHMIFTFGDLKDLCLNKDIGNKSSGDVELARQNIDNVFKPKNGQPNGKVDETEREKWWDNNGLDIWKGMLCGLSHHIKGGDTERQKLTNNEKYQYDSDILKSEITNYILYNEITPQFLRWFTEWSDEFCEKYKEESALLHEKCRTCKVNGSATGKATCDKSGKPCSECQEQCPKYTKFIDEWKKHWDQQQKKFQSDKTTQKIEEDVVDSNTPAHTYLDQVLELFDQHGNCMKTASSQPQSRGAATEDMPQALDPYPPDGDYVNKCTCVEDTTNSGQQPQTPGTGKDSGHNTPNPPKPMPNPNPSGTQEQPCDIANNILKTKDPQTHKIAACEKKNFENKSWNCDSQIDPNHNGACMPPRRQKLCIHNLTKLDPTKTSKEKDLRKALIECASIETYWLWDKYKQDHTGVEDNLKNKGTIPEEFKRQMFYTLGDYRDLCLGKDIGNDGGKTARDNISAVFKSGTPKPEEWWKTIEKEVWEGMLCALSYDDGKKGMDTTTQTNLKNNNEYNTVTFGDPTKSSVSTDGLAAFASRPQFLRWLTEWYDDYCKEKHTKLQDVEKACKPQNSGIKCDSDCTKKCDDYTNFMKERKGHWDKQKTYYTSQKATTSGYDEDNAKEYLKEKFTVTCGSTTSSGTNQVETNINALTQPPPAQSPPQPHYDVDVYCGCKKYIKDTDYDDISGESNCKGLMKDINGTPGIKWQNNKDDEYKHLVKDDYKDDPVPQEVYIPPRRQRICFEGLDKSNKEGLPKKLMEVAATEGYNLGKYYKAKNDNSTDEKYKYDVQACNALKYSFLDLRDIIVGYDMLEPEKTNTESNLKKIFTSGSQTNSGAPGSPERKQWWKDHEKCVWKAMLCGYKKGRGEDKIPDGCDDPPSGEPIGVDRDSGKNLQFLRWFAEWGEDYCKKYHVELGKLSTACPTNTCDKNGNEQKCKEQCKKYTEFITQWKDQYDKQKSKFNEDKGKKLYEKDKEATDAKDAREFLKTKLEKICKVATNGCDCMKDALSTSNDTPKSLDDVTKSDYKDKCGCDNKVVPPVPQPRPIDPGGGQTTGQTNTTNGQNPKQDPDSSGGQKPVPDPGNPGQPGGPSVHPPAGPSVPSSGSQDPFKELETCPFQNGSGTGNQTYCSKYAKDRKYRKYRCRGKTFNKDLNDWTSNLLKHLNDKNKGILVPPRMRRLCLKSIRTLFDSINDQNTFKKYLLRDAYNEARILSQYYNSNNDEILQAMKYSFADFGNIVKGDDIFDDLELVQKQLSSIFKQNGNTNETENRKEWWEENKKHVWNVMMCHYKGNVTGTTNNSCPEYDNIDETPQFLRWFTEWAQHFCERKKELEKEVKTKCSSVNCINGTGNVGDTCKKACQNYSNFISGTKQAYIGQKTKYEEFKNSQGDKEAHEYLKGKCKEVKCECLSKHTDNGNNNWKDAYETFDDTQYKNICECKKPPSTNPSGKGGGSFSDLLDQLKNTFFIYAKVATEKGIETAKTMIPEVAEAGLKFGTNVVMPIAKDVATSVTIDVLDKLTKIIKPSDGGKNSAPSGPPQPAPPVTPGGAPSQPSVTPETVSLSTLPPVGISFVLGAIALLFYLK
ncbi:erythrocyte membrane protein 1, PfEMP1, putative [Plasmodium sp. gorilla clade G2]|uniref:erythrocyte membrane protein 1, PfEMP1, putative n=1 Tax=Plasmodium sp. gorilla clade G2 TaxID=880535 RepID=UPI000D2C35DA|nr:erythrocyte membrane protein 1, PfEMP1, putative [Plasmodium sp. gorilla clade G2]SOV20025.1 erythrocyte membrane protein 1, PfEMP1, putative [Plasmodium sp. gorilla clade G2]